MNERLNKYWDRPDHCPVCGDYRINIQGDQYDHRKHYNYLRCEQCSSEWTERYDLSVVEITNNNKEGN